MGFTPYSATVGNQLVPLSAANGGTGQTSLPLTVANGGTGAATLNAAGIMTLQATTGNTGYTLVNSTGTVITYTTPNDGNVHRVILYALIHVSSNETGGQITITYTGPQAGATVHTTTVFAAALSSDTAGQPAASPIQVIVGPNTAVSVLQATALSGGAAVAWCELWGS